MLLYDNNTIVINTLHVASVQLVPVTPQNIPNQIVQIQLQFMESGGKVIIPLNERLTNKLKKYYMTPTSMKKLSKGLLLAWMEVMRQPTPEVSMSIEDFIELVIKKIE